MSIEKIKLLDLCCGAGGAAAGYNQAAEQLGIKIEITGIDIEKQPNYPFNFIRADAVDFLKYEGRRYNRIHASPPCQKHSKSTARARKLTGKKYPDIMDEIRQEIILLKIPGVIENVPGAPMRKDCALRGTMFGLKVLRTRWFEFLNWFMMSHEVLPKNGKLKTGDYVQVIGHGQLKPSKTIAAFKEPGNVNQAWSRAMGIDWMTTKELSQAIPPAYTEYIGEEFLK